MDNDTPRYRALGPVQIDGHVFGRSDEFDFSGEPNSALLPLNEAAERRMAQWRASLAEVAGASGSVQYDLHSARNAAIV